MRAIVQLGASLGLVAVIVCAAWSQDATFPIIVANPVSPPSLPCNGNGAAPFYPSQIQQAYGINTLQSGGYTGAGQTIAIIDAYNYPNALSAVNYFSNYFGLQQFNVSGGPTFTQLNENGGTSLPGTDPAGAGNNNWEFEEALDIEWAHSVAPNANIILYEATSPTFSDLDTAVTTAKNNSAVSVLSMSYGAGEFSGETSYDSLYTTPAARLTAHQGVTFCASTGDGGAPGIYPAFSPNVVAVGGTSLYLNSNNSYNSESAWSGGGGGKSTQESRPSCQNCVANVTGSARGTPDVSMDADPNTGVLTYDPYNGTWFQIGGTSLASPCFAGLVAIADQERSAAGNGTLDGLSQTLPALYSLSSADFHDITTGSNGYGACAGYDLATGLGTPVASALVPGLALYGTTITPEPSTVVLFVAAALSLLVFARRKPRTA